MTKRALTVLQIDEIRARHAQGLVTVPALAREYRVGEQTIRRVLREPPAVYGKARRAHDHKYGTSARGRARRRRADKTYNATERRWASRDKARARKYGVKPEDIERLIEQQGGKCPLTGRPITSRSHVDHAHEPGLAPLDALRGVVHGQVNAVLPNDDSGLIRFANNLMRYAGKRFRLRAYLSCRDFGQPLP